MFRSVDIKSYALTKNNYISISLDVPKIATTKPKKIKKSSPVSSVVEDTGDNIDVNNLFSDVWTKKITPKKKVIKKEDTKRLLDIQKKIQKKEKNSVNSISEVVNNLNEIDTHNESEESSTAEQVNEYLAKIQAIVYRYFRVPANTQGNSVKSVIELNALGKVIDFRILSYSNNPALNEEVDNIKARIMDVIFPIHPQNIPTKTVVILTSKE
ncbi:TonB C-terminal domain-containing protein [Sulfurimonas aquatica]|nr:TonB C-terminal domain-containing protein [Sulfurimonas aquatica]